MDLFVFWDHVLLVVVMVVVEIIGYVNHHLVHQYS